jgi:tRNA-binding protein
LGSARKAAAATARNAERTLILPWELTPPTNRTQALTTPNAWTQPMHFDTSKQRAAPISFDDFLKVDIRVGTIIACEPYPEARKPAYKLQIDFGPDIGIKRSAAQITTLYQPEILVGRQIAAVINFPPRQIGKFMSEVLTLGFPSEAGEVVLISPNQTVPNGGRLF